MLILFHPSGDDVFVDGYNIDICVTGSQKCLAAPPGMAAITLSDDAWNVVDKTENDTYYLNMRKYKRVGTRIHQKLLTRHQYH